MTSSTVSSESAPRSSTNEALEVTAFVYSQLFHNDLLNFLFNGCHCFFLARDLVETAGDKWKFLTACCRRGQTGGKTTPLPEFRGLSIHFVASRSVPSSNVCFRAQVSVGEEVIGRIGPGAAGPDWQSPKRTLKLMPIT